MKKSDVKKITDVTEGLGWSLSINNDELNFQRFSPEGQDFNISVSVKTLEELKGELQRRYESFDCSEEAYKWLDESGHGTNGAPYDMKDLYEDMEACKSMLEELSEAILRI